MSVVLGPEGVGGAVHAMGAALLARLEGDARPIAVVGIRSGGVPLAERLRDAVERSGRAVLRGHLDITLYRDDLYTGLEKPALGDTDLPFEVTGSGIVLVDDVLFTGRTIRAALGELHDFGRPAWVRLAVLVDRGHRELPIQADIVGLRVETALRDRVHVDWSKDEVRISAASR